MAEALEGTTAATTETTTPPAWYAGFPTEIQTDVIKAFKEPVELAKAFIETSGKVPVVPEKYEFTYPGEFTKEHIDYIHTRAKEIGLTQAQYEQLAKNEIAALAKATEEAVTQQKGVVETLRKEWGAQTDERVKAADKVLTDILGDAWARHFSLDKHPEVIKAFWNLSTKLSEDTLRMGGGTNAGGLKTGADGTAVFAYPNTPTMNK